MCDTLNGFHFKKTLWECHNVTARVQQGAINFLLPSLIIFIDDIFFLLLESLYVNNLVL